jgi:hypothetical protein
MRKLLIAALLIAAPACKREKVGHVVVDTAATVEEAPRLASSLQMGDATMAKQLAGGFYDIESGSWRWTMQKFAVNLHAPAGSAQQGAVLEFHLTIPAPSIQKLGSITLTTTIGGTTLDPETYDKAGEYTYKRDVPANLLTGDAVRVDFQLDKAIPPGDVDKRELGVVATSVALIAK